MYWFLLLCAMILSYTIGNATEFMIERLGRRKSYPWNCRAIFFAHDYHMNWLPERQKEQRELDEYNESLENGEDNPYGS